MKGSERGRYPPGRTASRTGRLPSTTSPPSCRTAACAGPRELNTAEGETGNVRTPTATGPARSLRDASPYLWRAAEGGRGAVGLDVLLAQAEVCEDNVPLRVQQDVLGLQVSVDDVEGVEVTQGAGDLR